MNVSKRKAATADSHEPPPPKRATKRSSTARGEGPKNNTTHHRDCSDDDDADSELRMRETWRLVQLESLSKSTRAKHDRLVELYNDKIKGQGDPLLNDDTKATRIVSNWMDYLFKEPHEWDPQTQVVNTKHLKTIITLRPVTLTKKIVECNKKADGFLDELLQMLESEAKAYRLKQKKTAPCNPSNWISFLPPNLLQPGISPEAAQAVIKSVRDRAFNIEGRPSTKPHTPKIVASRGPVVRMKTNSATLPPTRDEYDAWARQNATSGHVRSRNQSLLLSVGGVPTTFCFQGDPTELQRFNDVTRAEGKDPTQRNCLCLNMVPCAMFTCLAVMANTSEFALRSGVRAVMLHHMGELCVNGHFRGRCPDQVVSDLETGRTVGDHCELVICAVLLGVQITLFGCTDENGVPFPPKNFFPMINEHWAQVVRQQFRVGSATAPIALWFRRVMDNHGEKTHQIDLIRNVSSYASGGTNDSSSRNQGVDSNAKYQP